MASSLHRQQLSAPRWTLLGRISRKWHAIQRGALAARVSLDPDVIQPERALPLEPHPHGIQLVRA